MNQHRLNGHKIVKASIRSPRVAFILDSSTQIEPVIRACSLSWGGKFFVIVPYLEETGITNEWWTVLKRYDPDRIIACCELPVGLQEQLTNLVARREKYHDKESRKLPTWNLKIDRNAIQGILIFNIIYALGGIKERDKFIPALFPGFTNSSVSEHFIMARYGCYTEDINSIGDILLGYHFNDFHLKLDNFIPTNSVALKEGFFDFVLKERRTDFRETYGRPIIDYTAVGLGLYFDKNGFLYSPDVAEYGASKLLIVSDPDSLEDFCWFWNLRSQRDGGMFPLWASTLMIKENVEKINQMLGGNEPLYLLSKSTTQRQLKAIADKLRGEKEVSVNNLSNFYSPKFDAKISHITEADFDEGSFLFNPFQIEEKVKEIQFCRHPSYFYFDLEIEAYTLPQIRTAEWSKHSLGPYDSTKSGLSMHQFQVENRYQNIYIPSPFEMLETSFRVAGYRIRKSDKGNLAETIINMIGSEEHIWLLSGQSFFELVDQLSEVDQANEFRRRLKRSRPKLNDQEFKDSLKQMASDYHKRIYMSYGKIKSLLGFSSQEILDYYLGWLLGKRIMQRGITPNCSYCGMETWVDDNNIKTSMKCFGCGKQYDVRLGLDNIQWLYRLNPLVAKIFGQGVFPHLVSLYYFLNSINVRYTKSPLSGTFYGIKLQKENSKDDFMEIDIAWIESGKIYIGECKKNGRELTNRDIEIYCDLAHEIDCEKVVFSAMDEINKNMVQRVCNKKKVEFEILEGHDLFDNYPSRDVSSGASHMSFEDALKRYLEWQDYINS